MRVAVAVPVRDEEDGLPALLHAFRNQTRKKHNFDASIHLLFDGCADRGVEIAASFLAGDTLRGDLEIMTRHAEPNAGRARRAAAALALRALGPREDAVILTTDADTLPDPDWIEQSVEVLADVDVVAGYTRRDRTTLSPSRDALEDYLERLHAFRRRIDRVSYDPAPSHPWVGGANLGIRLEAFRRLKGFRAIPTGEDTDLVDRARHAGLRVQHSRTVRVKTSSRTRGRARGGLADALDHMRREVAEPRVEHPADAGRQYARHAAARRLFDCGPEDIDWSALARTLGTSADLRAIAHHAVNAEAFVMKAVPSHPTRRDLPLGTAAKVLKSLKPEQFLDHAY